MATKAAPLERARNARLTVLNVEILQKLQAGPKTTTEIKDACSISMQLACHNVKKLVKTDFITKDEDSGLLELTDAGREIITKKS